MKTNKIELATTASTTAIAELHGGSGVPIQLRTPSPANDDEVGAVGAVDEAGKADLGPVALSGDVEGAEARKAAILSAIGARETPDASPERRRFLEAARTLAERDERLPRGGNKYHLRAVLALAGVSFSSWLEQPALRDDVQRIASLFEIGDTQATAHVRGGMPLDSLIRRARETMDEMERTGERVASDKYGRARPSTQGFADRMGVPKSIIASNSMLKGELNDRIKAGRLVLGDPYVEVGAPARAERRAARQTLKALIERHAATGRPIPASSERSNRIDLDALLDEAGIVDPRLRECMKCDQVFRHDLAEVIRRVRLKPVHLSRIDPSVVSYDRLKQEGVPLLREIYRADTPKAVPGSGTEDRWVANQQSFLSRAMRVEGRTLADDATADFAGETYSAMVLGGSTGSAKGDDAYVKGMAHWVRVAKAIAAATAFPASFAGALDAAMVAANRNAPSLAAALGCLKGVIHAWRQGVSLPTWQNVHLVARLEAELGLVSGTLSKRLPAIRNSRTMYGGRKEVTLSDGRVVPLAGLWRYMHPDAPTWPEERLRQHVEEAHERVHGADTAHRVRMRKALSNGYRLPEPDPSSPIWAEMDDLVRFKSGAIDDGRLRDPDSEWRSPGTVKLHRGQVTTFVRWLMLSVELGGAGVAPERISFSLILNDRLVLKYVTWRINRAADLEIDGKRIGPKITATEKMLVSFFASLLDPEYGWLTQSRHLVMPPTHVPTTFRMPFIRDGKDGMEIEDGENCPMVEVFPAELARKCATRKGWRKAAKKSCLHVRSTGSRLAKSFKLIRDPQQLIMPILRHRYPIAVGLRMAKVAYDHARPIATAPVQHARDVQAVVAFMLLLLIVFRSATMRDLTWKADGSGNVRRLPDGYEIVKEAEAFKNCFNPELFGPSWNRRDYERTLGNWGSLNEVLDHYLEHCRPILLAGRESDLLFPPPAGRDDWSESNFNHLVMSFTRKWVVWNPRHNTGMKGVRAFGPHPARNIVATHILLNHPTEERWPLAARILGTGVEKVRLRYGWVTARTELAKANGLYDEASEIAASDAVLY